MYQTDCRRVTVKTVRESLNKAPTSFQVFDKINSSKDELYSDSTRTYPLTCIKTKESYSSTDSNTQFCYAETILSLMRVFQNTAERKCKRILT
jgi:hypothetical protein